MDIKAARRWLAGTESEGDCCSCGGGDDLLPAGKVLGAAFTAYAALCVSPGASICSRCAEIIGDRNMRVYPVKSMRRGQREIATIPDIYELIKTPPSEFVISVAYSRKKHHWLYAGLSSPSIIIIGTDDGSVIYRPEIHRDVLNTVVEAIEVGMPVTQLASGRYHPTTYHKFGTSTVERIETTISSHRSSGLLGLLIKVAPRPEKKAPIPEEAQMIRDDDKAAAALIALIAQHSQLRRDRGKDFWDGILQHRLNRVARTPLDQATAKLLQWLGVTAAEAGPIVEMLDAMTPEAMQAVEKSITERPQLVAALAYDQLKATKAVKKQQPTLL